MTLCRGRAPGWPAYTVTVIRSSVCVPPYVDSINPDDPLAGLVIGERPDPQALDGWTVIETKSVSLNHHDLWSLRGVGLKADQLPMIIGGDVAGIDTATGAEVSSIRLWPLPDWTGDETMDPGRTLFSEKYQGTLAEYVAVPTANVLPKPSELSFAEAACLPTAWLTAYRMLFRPQRADARPDRPGPGHLGRRRVGLHQPGPGRRVAGLGDGADRGQARTPGCGSARTRLSHRAPGCPSGSMR